MKLMWFTSGAVIGLTTLSIAMVAVPSTNHVTDDTAIYQSLSEIQVRKEANVNFDGDIAQLSQIESRYHEKLPQLTGPMKRIALKKYKYSGDAASSSAGR